MVGDFKIICTNAGKHAPATIRLYTLSIPEGKRFVVRDLALTPTFEDLWPMAGRNRGAGLTGVPKPSPGKGEFYCMRCGRDPRPSRQTLLDSVNAALLEKRATLDISDLC